MKKMKWLIIAAAVVISGIFLYSASAGGTSTEVLQVSKGEVRQYLEDTAQVVSREKQTIYIEGSGKVVDTAVDVGEEVEQGDLLLSLDKTALELQLKNAEAGIEALKAQLKGTELINYANKIEQAKVAADQAEIAYESARRNFENAEKLYNSDSSSRDEYEKARDVYKAAAAALELANLQLADVKKGVPEYVKSGYEAQLEQAVINRDTVLQNIRRQDVRAPISGTVIEKLIEENSMAVPSAPAFVIGSVKSLELNVDILADDINKVKLENEVEISGKPLDDTVLKGKVVKIAPAAKSMVSSLGVNQKRVAVTVEIIDKTELLKPGYSVDARIITEVKNDVIRIPDSAVFDYKGKSHVFIMENGKAALKEVKRGIESENYIEILEGLKEGDTIIVKPGNDLKEGAKIKPLD